ncbi:MAG: serine hydrolase domain-containing protein [Bacteroidia bacterium]|nr:serine hydrolase domain-containing protein [Bacteroidia bacterium]
MIVKPFAIILTGLMFLSAGCQSISIVPETGTCTASTPVNPAFSRSDALTRAMEDLVQQAGVPGCALAVYSETEGWWEYAAGFARIEDQTTMQPCHQHFLQSISKTYMAVGILRLYEQGKLSLDAPFSQYLPERYHKYLPDTEKITVRMLLNHTSGLPEYNFAAAYVTQLLQHPDRVFSPEEYLGFIKGKALDFEPGSKYAYRNTNYLLLALIADALTGDHVRYLREHIFMPLGLTHTFYRETPDYLNTPDLVNSYWDRYGDGQVENVTAMQRTNVSTLIGDDGIITSPAEAVLFLKGLIGGQLLADSTLSLMKTWVHDSKGNPAYGLGLDYSTIADQPCWGHSGGGIGAGCELYYFPAQQVYVFFTINLGAVTESPIHQRAGTARKSLYKALLE